MRGVDPEVTLPEFAGDRETIEWQTKTIGRPAMRTFWITGDGRLLRKERSYRERTPEECDTVLAEAHRFSGGSER